MYDLRVPITDITLARRRRKRDALTINNIDVYESSTTTTTAAPSTQIIVTTPAPNPNPDTVVAPLAAASDVPVSSTQSPEEYDAQYLDYFNFYTGELEQAVAPLIAGGPASTPSSQNASKDDEDYWSHYDEYFDFYDGDNSTARTTEAPTEDDDDDDDFVSRLPPEVYCDLIETLNDKCGQYSLLELWKYDEDVISRLTYQDIIDAINTAEESPVFGYETNYTEYLGHVRRNSSGHVVGAKTVRSVWRTEFDPSLLGEWGESDAAKVGLELEVADPFTLSYEMKLINLFRNMSEEVPAEYTLYYRAPRSFSDEMTGAIMVDSYRMVAGYLLMFIYTVAMLGRPNSVEHRTYLALAGIMSVLLGLGISFGLSFAWGYKFTTITGVLPFLAMGIGIDDMFVIMQCLKNLNSNPRNAGMPLSERIALTMKTAGVSITLTSVTDVLAFFAGSITVREGMKSVWTNQLTHLSFSRSSLACRSSA